jgi:hypothetical protein
MFDNEDGHDQATLIDTCSELMLSIDQDAALYINTENKDMRLTPQQVLALGDFLHATQLLWRP